MQLGASIETIRRQYVDNEIAHKIAIQRLTKLGIAHYDAHLTVTDWMTKRLSRLRYREMKGVRQWKQGKMKL